MVLQFCLLQTSKEVDLEVNEVKLNTQWCKKNAFFSNNCNFFLFSI